MPIVEPLGKNDWSVRNEIVKRVQQEDIARWGRAPDVPFSPVPPIRDGFRPSKASIYAFLKSMAP